LCNLGFALPAPMVRSCLPMAGYLVQNLCAMTVRCRNLFLIYPGCLPILWISHATGSGSCMFPDRTALYGAAALTEASVSSLLFHPSILSYRIGLQMVLRSFTAIHKRASRGGL